MAYEKLKIEDFGRKLIVSGDIDPIYIMLSDSKLTQNQLRRWLVAYWCFYSAGVASYLSELEGEEFWDQFTVACLNQELSPIAERWERGKERRHFRGYTSEMASKALRRKYVLPEDMVNYIIPNGEEHFSLTTIKIKQHYGFGDWISFKICDMLERIFGANIVFDDAAISMFEDPTKAAFLLWEERNPEMAANPLIKPKKEKILRDVTVYLENEFKDLPAPPRFERQINIQEVETVLCKWKSHMHGKYPMNNDIKEIYHSLEKWECICTTATILKNSLPKIKD